MLKDILLNVPIVYKMSQSFFGGAESRSKEKEYLRHDKGANILDIGCGTADLVDGFFEDANYYGVDMVEKYIDIDKKRFEGKSNIHFYCCDINELSVQEMLSVRDYDIIMMIGVLHHMSNEECDRCLKSIRTIMGNKGRFVALEPLRWKGQPPLSRILVDMDRGKYVRTEEEYVDIVSRHIDDTRYVVRDDMYRFPYRHIIFY